MQDCVQNAAAIAERIVQIKLIIVFACSLVIASYGLEMNWFNALRVGKEM